MIILVINCGSSSIKYQLLDMKNDDVYDVLAKGIVEKIGLEMGCLQHTATGKEKVVKDLPVPDHKVGMQLVLEALTDSEHGVLKSLDDIEAVGHRIVHGGEYFSSSALVNEDVMKKIEICCDFAPLHNPAHILGIRAVQAVLPSVPQVVTFDTAFHQTMPAKAYLYGLPLEYYKNYKVRRYGFHGTSHSFVSKRAVEFLGLDKDNSKVIVCHLGNGSSISAVVNGKCVDTTMGLTPLEGVVMGTRSGNIDPAIMEFIAKKENLDIAGMMNVLNKKSGLLGLSGGLSSDFRDLNEAAEGGNEDAANAIDVLCYGIAKFVGGYVAAMNGVDAIVFTAGIGENAIPVREKVVSYLGYLGVTLDKEANGVRGEEIVISTPDSKVKVAVIPTNEELAICRETVALV